MRSLRCARIALGFLIACAQASWAHGLHIVEYPIPTPNAVAGYIAAEPDGNIWFTERNGAKVARITPQGVITDDRTEQRYLVHHPDLFQSCIARRGDVDIRQARPQISSAIFEWRRRSRT